MEKNQVSLLLALLCSFTFACSQAEQKGKSKKGKKEAAEETDSEDDGTDGSDGATEAGTAEAGEAEGGEDDLGELETGDGGGDAAIEQLKKDCGDKGETAADPGKVVYEKDLTSAQIKKTQFGVTAVIETDLAIKVTGEKTVQDSTVKIVKLEGFFAAFGKEQAEKAAKESSGPTTLVNVPFKKYSDLATKYKQWDGVLCTFVPSTKVTNERGDFKTVATFDPPLPSSVSPRAVAARYKEEIGSERVFKNIKAKISESDNPDLDGEDSITGTVTVEKVDADTEVEVTGGDKVSIKADVAYKVTYDFGDAKKTFALGLPPEVTYYISHKKADLVANVVDTSATGENGAVVVFEHDK